jgi:hypothetical protein
MRKKEPEAEEVQIDYSMHLTDHLYMRWEERFPDDLEGKTDEEKEEFIRKTIAQSYPIYTQREQGSPDVILFLYKDYRIVLVCENTNTAITVFPTDYNHTPDIDKMISNQLFKKIVEIDNKIAEQRKELDQSIVQIDKDISATDEQLKVLQRQMDQLKTKRSRLTAQREELLKSFDVLLGERDSIGKQLAYSVTYRLENKANEVKRLDQMIASTIGPGTSKKRR